MTISWPLSVLKGAIFLSIAFSFLPGISFSQSAVSGPADKILAIVGRNRIILQSELDIQFAQVKQQDPAADDTIKCHLLQQMIVQKLLVEAAERDSLLVSDDEVEGTIDNRIRQFIRQYGSREKLEEIAGKTVYQLKEENKEMFKEQLMSERMQAKILENIKITPSEVHNFYNNIPADS